MLELGNRRTTKHWCYPQDSENITCGVVEYNLIKLRGNHASFAGGGIFMSGAQNPHSFCMEGTSRRTEVVKQSDVRCFKLFNNTIAVRCLSCSSADCLNDFLRMVDTAAILRRTLLFFVEQTLEIDLRTCEAESC